MQGAEELPLVPCPQPLHRHDSIARQCHVPCDGGITLLAPAVCLPVVLATHVSRGVQMTGRLARDDEVATWQEQGWVLVEGLIPAAEIDAAAADLWEMFPSPQEFHADPA